MSKNWLTKATTTMKNAAGRTGLKIQKNSPEILLGIGIVTFVGTVVLACRATLNASEVIEYYEERMDEIKRAEEIAKQSQEEAKESGDDSNVIFYDEELIKEDKVKVYVRTGVKLARAYAPSVALGAVSLACILTSRNIMQKRYLGAISAYTGLREAFDVYRKRVIEEQGEIMDRHYRYGTELESRKILDENGKVTKEKETVELIKGDNLRAPSDAAVYFDESNPNWDANPMYSKMFLRAQQNIANDILHSRGHIFLNEVYDMLGFPHTSEGALIGWVMGAGDDYIDFGLFNADNENSRMFVNGKNNIFLLDFNHDGIIYNKI